MFEIYDEHDLPIPDRGQKKSKYPFEALEVGQSFVIPKDKAPKKGVPSIRAAMYHYKRETGSLARFLVRQLESGDFAVWRLGGF